MDGRCHSLTASYVRDQHRYNQSVPICDFYEGFDTFGREDSILPGAYSLDDLKNHARKKGYCPYFLARHLVSKLSLMLNYYYSYFFFTFATYF